MLFFEDVQTYLRYRDLTPVQQEMVKFIARSIHTQHQPPTVREIGEHMGWTGINW